MPKIKPQLTEQEKCEQAYLAGKKQTQYQILQLMIQDGYKATQIPWNLERLEVVQKLREICGEHGDNKWEDELHLSDVLENHLLPYLE